MWGARSSPGTYAGLTTPGWLIFASTSVARNADVAIEDHLRRGAEMWEILDGGTQGLVAVLGRDESIPQGN